jgi:hypothetical protein
MRVVDLKQVAHTNYGTRIFSVVISYQKHIFVGKEFFVLFTKILPVPYIGTFFSIGERCIGENDIRKLFVQDSFCLSSNKLLIAMIQ